jgi:hypothetical protein
MVQKKIRIGVIVYTKIGTNTSILMDEFRFFNNFKRENPDCEFVFIGVSDFTRKSIIKNRGELNFPVSIITVKNPSELHKLDGLSGVFSYMTRNTFFGGNLDTACTNNYMISAYCTSKLGIPLFIRVPDSEYPYIDYKKMTEDRMNMDTPSTPSFIERNREKVKKIPDYINYDLVKFVANGSRVIADWVVDVAHNDIKPSLRMMDPEKISEQTLFVSDADLFNVHSHFKKYEYLPTKATINKFVFIGYLQGSVCAKRLKVLPKVFQENKHQIPTDIIGPGASSLEINREDVSLIDKGIYGDNFFETMNSYLAYIFIGKGNEINKYINKTVYDCISARCPIVVYSECDKTGILFNHKEFYFSNEDELLEIYQKLQDPEIREKWIEAQRVEIMNKLNTIMDPMFKFKDFCEAKEDMKCELTVKPLF